MVVVLLLTVSAQDLLSTETIHQCGLPATVSSCQADQAAETRLHHTNPPLDVCPVFQGYHAVLIRLKRYLLYIHTYFLLTLSGSSLRLPPHSNALFHLRDYRHAGESSPSFTLFFPSFYHAKSRNETEPVSKWRKQSKVADKTNFLLFLLRSSSSSSSSLPPCQQGVWEYGLRA